MVLQETVLGSDRFKHYGYAGCIRIFLAPKIFMQVIAFLPLMQPSVCLSINYSNDDFL